jgi:hypothetical protein
VLIIVLVLSIISMSYVFIKQSIINKRILAKYKKRIKDLEKELSDLKYK